MTPEVAQQLRLMGGFDLLKFRPRMGSGSDRDVPVVDGFHLLRQAIGSVPWLGLNDTVAVDALCLTRSHTLDGCFFKVVTTFRAHVLKHIEYLGSGESTKFLGNLPRFSEG